MFVVRWGCTPNIAPLCGRQNGLTHFQAVRFMHGHGPDYTNHLRPFAQVALVVGDFTNEQQQNLQRVERFPRQVATYIILRWWVHRPESLELLFDCRLVSYVIGFIMF